MKVISPLYGNFNQLVYSNSLKLPCTYQVAKIIFEQGTCDAITKELKKCPGALNRKFSPYLLTPSHLAVIGGNAGALEALHAAKAKMDELDFQGYTPLHHAAMKGDFAAVSKLLNWGANPNRLNVFGGTYMDLLRLNQPFRSNKEEVLDANLFSVHTNEQYQVDQTCLAPDVKFIHENVATPKQLIQLWKVPAPGITLTNDEANSAYENYAKNPPPLAIQSLKNDKGKEMCGVVALRPIKKGEIIAEYTGKIVDPQEKYDEVYSWDAGSYVIDAGQYRSAASMINAGFPSATVISIAIPKGGIPNRFFVVAVDDIAEGEQLTIHYGATYRFNPEEFVELKAKARDDFLDKINWSDMVNIMGKKIKPSTQQGYLETIDTIGLGAKIEYLITVSLLYSTEELVKLKKIKKSDLNAMKFISNNYFGSWMPVIAARTIDRMEQILEQKKWPEEL